jgi:uncharacterized protein
MPLKEVQLEITDEQVLDAYKSLPIDHDSKNFWKGCLQKKLVINRCQSCGNYIQFPKPMCPKCWSEDVVPTQVSGKGSVYLASFYHQGPGVGAEPYPAVAIELVEQEGLRISATMINCKKEDIHIGMPVDLVWLEWQGAPIPAFQPDPSSSSA